MKTCNDVMTPDPFCCVAEDSVVNAAKAMKEQNVGSIPVMEDRQSRKLIGIITDRDIAVKVVAENKVPGEIHVGQIMTRDLVVCHQDEPVDQAIEAMSLHQVRRIPVVDRDNSVIGIIAQGDVALRLNDPETTGEVVAEISEKS